MNITFEKYEFSEPKRIAKWVPPEGAGLYVILKPDLSISPLHLRPIYFGQSEDLSERNFIKSHHKYKDWIKEVGAEEHIFIAIYQMLGSTEEERKTLEAELIAKYQPVCNEKKEGS